MPKPVLLAAALTALLTGGAAALEEHPAEDKPAEETVRAANLILGQMTNYLADVAAMKTMTDAQKVAYIKDKASERVVEHVIAADAKVINEAMDAVLTKSVQYYTYTEVARPLLEGAAKTGTQVNRSLLDSGVAAIVDTRITAVKSLYGAAKLTGTAIGTMAKDGPMAGVKVIGGALAEKLGEYFVPGYSWIKLGADFTQALLDYVIAYANESAKEGIVELLFNAKSEPDKFLKWLVKSSEAQIAAEIEAEWENFNVEAGHFTFSKSPEGCAAMREKIKGELFAIRKKALDDMKAQEESSKLIRWALEDKLRERTIAEEKAREAAQKVQNDKLRLLIKIEEFKNIYLGGGNAKAKADDIANESKKFSYTTSDANGNPHTVVDEDNVRAVFHPMSLTLDSLKPAIEHYTLKLDQEQSGPAAEAVEKQLSEDWERQYKAYQDDYDAVPWRAEGTKGTHYYDDMLRYRELTKAQYGELRFSVSKYHGFLRTKSQETYLRIMADIHKVSAGLDQRVIQNSLAPFLKDLPSRPEVETPLRVRLGGDLLPVPEYSAVQHGTWFGSLFGAIRSHIWALENDKRRIDTVIEQIDANLDWSDKAAETRILVDIKARARAEVALEAYASSTILMQLHLKDLEKQGLLEGDAWAKPLITHLNALVADNTRLRQIRKDWGAVSEDIADSIAAEKKMMVRLDNAGDVLGELYRLHPREQLSRWTVDCSETVPGYVYSAVEGGMECADMARDPARFLNSKALAKTQAEVLGKLRATGIFSLDLTHKIGIEAYAKAVVPSYFSNPAEIGPGMGFVSFGKSCCFYKASYFTSEAAKLGKLGIETGADGDGYQGRLVGTVHFGEALANSDFWADHTKPGCGPLKTAEAKDGLIKAGIDAYCAALAGQAKLYSEYKKKAAAAKTLEAEIEALTEKVNKANSAASASMAADDYKAVVAYESEVSSLKSKVDGAGGLYEDHKSTLLSKFGPMEGSITSAKTMSQKGTTTSGGGMPGGGQQPGGQQPGGQQPGGQQPGGQQPGGQQPGGQKPGGQQPGGQKPGGQQPGGQQPGGQQPGGQQPGGQQPGGRQPGGQQMPAGGKAGAQGKAEGVAKPGMMSFGERKEPESADPPPMAGRPSFAASAVKKPEQVEEDAVRQMYADFAKAYEDRSVSQVLRFIHSDWEAGDGSSIADLQGSLSNTFRVFNDVRCTVSNVKLTRLRQGRWRASYEMAIVGRIFAQNLKHEERSNIDEEVSVENGKAVISRTLQGNFWYFE